MVRPEYPPGPARDTDPRKARAEAAMALKSTSGTNRRREDEDTDPSIPIFFYMPHEHPYGIFCQWQKSHFTVPKSSFSYLDRNIPPEKTQQREVGKKPFLNPASPSANASSTSRPENGAPTQGEKEEMMTFTCCEEYMMYSKALFFNDTAAAKRILATSSPKGQKAIGRLVKGFDEHEWSLVRLKVGEEGNYAKFSQDLDL